ncbi:hypothetical protein ACWGBH_11555 [Streptomyces massasporeus]
MPLPWGQTLHVVWEGTGDATAETRRAEPVTDQRATAPGTRGR